MNGRRSIIAQRYIYMFIGISHCFGIKVWLLNACVADTAKHHGHRTM